ncbi:MAG: glycosyltransferase [Bryobacteraceae bacterium]
MSAAPRIALFADSLLEVNGVALTCQKLAEYAKRHGLPLLVVHAGAPTGIEKDGSLRRLSLATSKAYLPLENDLRFDLLFWRHLDRVQKALEEFGAGLVHLTGPNHTGFLGAVAAKRLSLPVVMSWHTNVHDYAAWRLPKGVPPAVREAVRRWTWRALALYYRQAGLILAPNRAIGEALERATGKPWRIMLRGVDCELFHPRRRNRDDGVFVAGYVGRLSPEKCVRVLRTVALAFLASARVDFRIEIVGEGSERAWLEEHVPRARFHSVLRGEQLAQAYANFDVFVFPSRTDTYGNAVQEAMASGVPCLVTDKGGPATLVADGVTGRICRTDDELAATAVDMAIRPEWRRKMGEAARRAAEQRGWESVGRAVWDAYADASALPAQRGVKACCVA